MNGLARESSLYLRSHAEQPIQWIAWPDTPLLTTGKLALISIGYASCHWCHQMSRDVFNDEEVAQVMNEHFTCIKVDRESRPDIDRTYMVAASALLQGQVGWPLNVITLPDGRPIWASTYLAKPPWLHAMRELAQAAHDRPHDLEEFAKELMDVLQNSEPLEPAQSKNFESDYLSTRDMECGGMGFAPKFPNPHFLRVISRHVAEAKTHVGITWERIAYSGTYDQQLGGLMRYAVNRDWSIPHFEKMAYDQGAWLGFCAEHAVGNPHVMQEIDHHVQHMMQWLQRDFQLDNGLFASSIGAEVQGHEGQHLLWSDQGILDCLGDTEGSQFLQQLKSSARRVNGLWHIHSDRMTDPKWRHAVSHLAVQASKRPQPVRDEQCVSAWNASIVTGLAEWQMVQRGDIQFVIQAAEAHMSHFFNDRGPHHMVYPDGQATGHAYLDDLAMTIHMLIRVAQLTMNAEWLDRANHWTDWTVKHLSADGMFRYQQNQDLFWSPSPWEDDILPSPMGLMVLNMVELAHLKGRQDFHQMASQIISELPNNIQNPQQIYTWVEAQSIISSDQDHLLLRQGEDLPPLTSLPRIWGPSSELNVYGQLCSMTSCKFEFKTPKDLRHV